MKVQYRLVFWQNTLSMHQSSFLSEISTLPNVVEVVLIVDRKIDELRKKMNWPEPEFANVTVIVSPLPEQLSRYIDSWDYIHIFSGMKLSKLFMKVFSKLIEDKKKIGMMAETTGQSDGSNFFRYIQQMYLRYKYGRFADFFLTIGEIGLNWYQKCGYEQKKLFIWGYFINKSLSFTEFSTENRLLNDETFEIIYVGRLVHLKGVDILLKSVSKIETSNLNWKLTIVGTGPKEPLVKRLIKQLNLENNVKLIGFQENTAVMQMVRNSDLLVLINRMEEGWGFVINEAISCGTPVLCSKLTGSSCILNDSTFGVVVESLKPQVVSNHILDQAKFSMLNPNRREEIQKFSERISGKYGAEYFVKILDYTYLNSDNRPVAPWLYK
jgi:glycosyltransferase involved in cell wall biosynthesis